MTPEGVLSFIQNLREERLTSKQNSKQPKAKRERKARNSIDGLLLGLSEEEKLQLIKELTK